MTQLDIRALDANFEGWRKERVPDLDVADAFERYVVEAVFRSADLSDEEITSGMFGGGNDGGIDGAYFFIDRRLMLDGIETPKKPAVAELYLIQAKNKNGFTEDVMLKFRAFVEDVFDFGKSVETLTIYSARVRDFISMFRDRYSECAGLVKDRRITFVYASKSDHDPSPGVQHKVNGLQVAIGKHDSSAKVGVKFWGARSLLDIWRSQPETTHSLEVVHAFPHGSSFIGVARLDRFASFLTDESGELRYGLLEPNVRDYNGTGNPVNEEIRRTLSAGSKEEFWWLNNGVTILADDCNYASNKLNITAPELVNGLQTSHEIYSHFAAAEGGDARTIVIRVILPPNDEVRRKIIKATNSQTPVQALSLRANDDIHHDIEELFRLHKLYYDRRKGEYRRKKMQVASIVSITDVAQAYIAIALRLPDDARARPKNRLSTEEGYNTVFGPSTERGVYLACVLIDRSVREYLKSRGDLQRDERANLRFYVDIWLAATLAKKGEPNAKEIAALVATMKSGAAQSLLADCCNSVRAIYDKLGGDDRVAKGSAMRDAVLAAIKDQIDRKATTGKLSGG